MRINPNWPSSLAASQGISDELPLIDEDTVKSDQELYQMQTFPMTPSRRNRAQSKRDVEEDDDADNAIQEYIDQVARSPRSPGVRFLPDSPGVSSPGALKSAMKRVSAVPEPVEEESAVVEGAVRLDDIETQRVYTQKELDHARKVLRQAFVEFYRGLGMLSNYRYLRLVANFIPPWVM